MKKRNQLLETNKIAKMLEERRQKQIDQLYGTAAYASAAYASTSVSAYTSAASVSVSAYASAYTSASAWRQIARSGPDQAVLYYNWMTWEVKRGELK